MGRIAGDHVKRGAADQLSHGMTAMNPYRRRLLRLATAAAMLPATGRLAAAQSYPVRPVTMINPFPVGGPLDTLARLLAERMRNALGQPVIVENVTGASGSIGTARVAHSPPDGYTLGLGYWGTHVANAVIYPALHYDVVDDFAPIAQLARGPMLLIARKDLSAVDLTDLIAWLKLQAGKATLATSGIGSAVHVLGLLFQKLTGTQFQFVPYRGVAPSIQDLIARQIDLMFADTAVSLEHVRAGTVRALLVTAKSRLAAVQGVPTVGELGLPGLYFLQWYGLWAPRGTPADIIETLNSAVVSGLADRAVRDRLADYGMNVPPREEQSPPALAALQKAEIERWWPILKAESIRAD
jgi:tripartite-type tricarboxylate transporter receptor subunit TctC